MDLHQKFDNNDRPFNPWRVLTEDHGAFLATSS